MKFIFNTLIICLAFATITMTSCNSESTKPVENNKTEKKNTPSKKKRKHVGKAAKSTLSPLDSHLKNKLKLTDNQLNQINNNSKKYNKKIKKLKNQKKWFGQKNSTTRLSVLKAKENELKKIIPGKYDVYMQAISEWSKNKRRKEKEKRDLRKKGEL